MILTLDQTKRHLRIDDTTDDAIVTLYMGAAEQSAVDFLNRAVYIDQAAMDAAADADGVVATDAIRAALLLIVGKLYAFREDVAKSPVMELPNGAVALLMPYRVGMGI